MKIANVKYVKGSHRNYPQWDIITAELTQRFYDFHAELRSLGYEIKACNIACKDRELFWILLDDNQFSYKLEHYATLID